MCITKWAVAGAAVLWVEGERVRGNFTGVGTISH